MHIRLTWGIEVCSELFHAVLLVSKLMFYLIIGLMSITQSAYPVM